MIKKKGFFFYFSENKAFNLFGDSPGKILG